MTRRLLHILNSFLKIKPDTKNDVLFLYEEKYRAEKLVCLLSVDRRLQIKRGEGDSWQSG